MKKLQIVCILMAFILLVSACSSNGTTSAGSNSAEGYPQEQLEFTIAFGPGGGSDIMARTVISILEKHELYPETIIPENKEGGSGAVGWGYLKNQSGNPYHISTTSGSFITTPLLSDAGFNYEDFTHIALMATDDMFFLVRGDSEYDTLEEFIAAAKSNNFKVGGIGAANVDRMIVTTFAKEAGIELEYVSFNAQGENLGAILSGSLDAIVSNPGDVAGQIEAGELKALAFSGKSQLPDYPDVPTFIDKGYEVSIPMPRGIILPGDVPQETKEWWIDTMKKVAETPEWKEYIQKNKLTEYTLFGDDFTKYLEETTSVFEEIMIDLDIIEQ
ncbi:MAG TPA: tripartite tricarboxylate transporter substrate-binding protein [Bacillus sp. (in: firmicutes)]|uniref:Bug family tripartite tricarboxylate transporter substrate binding protein n=1 Tax=Bacillus litorisediminis TaxID=2922713 RepID=UPI001FAE8709|nr:tripartite tricarboxylate transporter substrate-binding protein [Bacillus litorisediminis]HWO76533.1 tripartite tricarboxylate transporter substrate-binding protein [Bacillus sp. (in: firmicutes)]